MNESDDVPPPSPGNTGDEAGWDIEHSPSVARLPSNDEEHLLSPAAARPPPPPQRAEPTLKERLVERERQARVETERARLKRQFALSSNGGALLVEQDGDMHKENGSVAGTLGDGSSVAAPPVEQEDDRKELGYVMERFLSERGDVSAAEQEEEPKPKPETGVLMERFLSEPVLVEQAQSVNESVDDDHVEDAKIAAEQEAAGLATEESVELDVERDIPALHELPVSATIDTNDLSILQAAAGSLRSYSTVTNRSLLESNAADMDEASESVGASLEPPSPTHEGQGSSINSSQQSPSDEPRRFFRLTAAEIQEMAAIEEASIGNAPPSEREDTISESSLADLVGDLGGIRNLERVGDFSERTTTTALESVSVTTVDGDMSERPSTLGMDRQSLEDIERASLDIERASTDIDRASVISHLAVSPGASTGSSVSIAVCPPSVTATEDAPDDNDAVMNDRDGSAMLDMPLLDDDAHDSTGNVNIPTFHPAAGISGLPSFELNAGSAVNTAVADNANVTNRLLRPGRVRLSPDMASARMAPAMPSTPGDGSGMKRSASMPDNKTHIMLENFEYDRNMHGPLDETPRSAGVDSYNELPGDELWASPRDMSVADRVRRAGDTLTYPLMAMLHPRRDEESREGERNVTVSYGATEVMGEFPSASSPAKEHLGLELYGSEPSEAYPLMRYRGHGNPKESPDVTDDHPDLRHLVSNVFSSVRSDSTATREEENNDSEKYLMTGVLARAFPERFFALLVTLVVEIPVLLMISGGSDRLCMLIGRRRYQLMMGFLPLSSAISGNCGLQASTLTTRAVSHCHVTKASYCKWLWSEVAAAGCLGLGMGTVLGGYGYVVSGMDRAFGLTIFMAQFVSIVTAGLTGTLAPLIFTFIFHRDSALYGGPLETAVQDIVGSFAMVVLSYRLLLFFGPMDVSPDDVCGEQA